MLQIYILKKQYVFGGHAEGKGIQIPLSQLVSGTGCPEWLGTSLLKNVKSQQDQTLLDLI